MYDYRSLFNLDGRTALVVGAASGIGQAAAAGLAAHGAYVYCADIDVAGCRATLAHVAEQGGDGEAVALNLLEPATIDAALAQIGAVDVLVCTPSVNVRKPLLAYTSEEFDKVVGLNLKGTFNLLQRVGANMVEHGGGSIIVFSSIRSQVVEPGQSIYATTKAGVVQMVRTVAAELAPHGVRANCIAPGVVETPLTQPIKSQPAWYDAYAAKGALNRWAQPHEMVGAVVFLASDAASFVTGSLLFVDGGWMAVDGRFSPPL